MDSKGKQSVRLDQLFRTCDTKGEGLIGPSEFRELCHKFGISDSDSDAIFNDLDHDGDGQIDFHDFSYGFRDFLTPGSRRGSLQIPLLTTTTGATPEGGSSHPLTHSITAYHQQLEKMEAKHASAKHAWAQFTNNVGITNVQPFVAQSGQQLYDIVEEMRTENGTEVSTKLEKALSSLISDVQTLHDEYKTLESSFRKEREVHASQLAALGEELDQQLAKTEAKAKAEAREEAQKQMDAERKKIANEMESQMAVLSAQLGTFQKVEQWLSREENREKRNRSPEEAGKLIEAESENRNLRSALVEAQMKATLLQTQLTQKRNEYLDLYQEFHTEKVAASEYRNQVDLMHNHLSILSEANRVLSDANDCFSMGAPLLAPEGGGTDGNGGSAPNSLPCDSRKRPLGEMVRVHSDELIKYETGWGRSHPSATTQDIDRDSGQETLLEELRAEGEESPLPSGVWSLNSTWPSPEESPPNLWTKRVGMEKGGAGAGCSFKTKSTKSPSSNTYKSFNEELGEFIKDSPMKSESREFPPQRTFKVILAGDASVGKTTFIERVCHGHFTANLSSTIGVDFRVKTLELDGKAVALQLWDTAGQERFRSLTKSYFRRADGVLLMYDVTNEQTFLSIRNWIQNVEEGAGRKVPIVLCGNKSDLRSEGSATGGFVSSESGAKLGCNSGALFIETSPKTGENILESLVILAREMSVMEDAELKNSVRLDAENFDENKSKKRGCCGSETPTTKESSTRSSYKSTC